MQFHEMRRQQFLDEGYYRQLLPMFGEVIAMFASKPAGSGDSEAEGWAISAQRIAANKFERLCVQYTAGEPIEPLRGELEEIVAAYERYGELLWKNTQDRNEPVFEFDVIDDYCQLLQLIGLCFLLHRRDLLPRIAAFQDGEDGKGNGGCDTLYEEFMAFGIGPEARFDTDMLCQLRPYESLFHGLTETTPAKGLKEIDLYLKHWYKDLAGTGWHDSHKPDENGNQGGYYGYWSFEAGAAVLLLGIEDDSSLHKYLYYPKDLVAWARQHATLNNAGDKPPISLSCDANHPCPRAGYWVTPAKTNSRRLFKQGELMPDFKSDYGMTIWQWDSKQN